MNNLYLLTTKKDLKRKLININREKRDKERLKKSLIETINKDVSDLDLTKYIFFYIL